MNSLCAPTPELSCFGCCPPIRPAHYDPLDYVGSLRREFLENRIRFLKEHPCFRPIMGYHCWALGFLDTQGRRVGCLLHPNQNQGQDLRFLIDYGNKCDREHCSAARMFELLPVEGRRFWLPLVRGMNSFYFSSPRSNPLFHILHWGPKVLESLRLGAIKKHWTASELLCEEPFLLDPLWKPKVHRYLFRLGIESLHGHEAEGPPLDQFCRKLLRRIVSSAEARTLPETDNHTNYTHLLPLEDDFLDFLRLGLGWRKSSLHQAIELKNRTHDLVF